MVTQLDWFDRRILTFVLEWAPYVEPPDEESFVRFGSDTKAILGRVDDLVAAHISQESHLEAGDFELIRRAALYRRTTNSARPIGRRRSWAASRQTARPRLW